MSAVAAAPREKTFLLARPEARVLTAVAERLPAWVKPDHLTVLGILAALGIAAAYVLSNGDRAWLWAARKPPRVSSPRRAVPMRSTRWKPGALGAGRP